MIELMLRDTGGGPGCATTALYDLDREEVVAVVGEFHSAVARPLAELAHSLTLPFVCSSATLDNLTSAPTNCVARLAPPQSYGWRVYADFLLDTGHEHVVLALQPDEYWSSGAAVLAARLHEGGALCQRIDVTDVPGSLFGDRLAEMNARDSVGALLLLVGYPEPLTGVIRTVRSDRQFDHVLIGDPAGRAEFPEWRNLLGRDGLGVPYLRYLPATLNAFGATVARRLAHRLGEEPSFVALEGYDTILALGQGLRIAGHDRGRLGRNLHTGSIPGTRGSLHFSRTSELPVLQWVWPPVQVAVHTTSSAQDRAKVLRQEHSPAQAT